MQEPRSWGQVSTEALAAEVIDVHAEGEPGRVVLADGLGIEGETMAQRLAWCERHLDRLRTLLLREPRGYPALCGVFVTPPVTPGADAGIIVLEQAGFRPMSGSNTMCAVTALLETGVLARREPQTLVRLDTAAGPVEAVARASGGEVTSVQVRNVPSFVVGLDLPVDVLGIGTVSADVAFGGQFYVQAPAAALGVELGAANAPAIARAAMGLLASAREQIDVRHPTEPDLDEIALVMLTGPADRRVDRRVDARNTVVLPSGRLDAGDDSTWRGTLDRSPCGTGTCARMACLHARGQLALGQEFVHEGALGTTFTGLLHEELSVGGYAAVLPSIEGRAWITGQARLRLDPGDPFPAGYAVADLWAQTDLGPGLGG